MTRMVILNMVIVVMINSNTSIIYLYSNNSIIISNSIFISNSTSGNDKEHQSTDLVTTNGDNHEKDD